MRWPRSCESIEAGPTPSSPPPFRAIGFTHLQTASKHNDLDDQGFSVCARNCPFASIEKTRLFGRAIGFSPWRAEMCAFDSPFRGRNRMWRGLVISARLEFANRFVSNAIALPPDRGV